MTYHQVVQARVVRSQRVLRTLQDAVAGAAQPELALAFRLHVGQTLHVDERYHNLVNIRTNRAAPANIHFN